MINLLFDQKTPGKVGNLTLDVLLSEQPTYTNDVTTFPVEDGSLISDGVVRQPLRLALTGLVSNSPLWQGFGVTSYYEAFRSSSVGQALLKNGTRCDDALQALLKMCGRRSHGGLVKNEVAPITVVTGLQVYPNMVMTSLVFDRDASTGDALLFTINLIEREVVTFSTTKIAFAEDKKHKLSSTTDVGKVQKGTEKKNTSILAGLYKKILSGR